MTGLSFSATIHFISLSLNVGDQLALSLVSLSVSISALVFFSWDSVSSWGQGLRRRRASPVFGYSGWLILFHFYLPEPSQWATVATLALLGIGAALEARKTHPGLRSFCRGPPSGRWRPPPPPMGAARVHLWLFLHSKWMLLRAWSFEREGRTALARPYFHWGQMAIAGSLLTVLPVFRQGAQAPLLPTLGH